MEDSAAIVVIDYDKGLFRGAQEWISELLDLASANGIRVIVDCKPGNAGIFRGADLIAPNEFEAEEIVEGFRRDPIHLLGELQGRLGPKRHLVVTMGAQGYVATDGNEVIQMPGHIVNVIDTVGAGDTFRAFLTLGLCAGKRFKFALRFANLAASKVVQKRGIAIPSKEDIAECMAEALSTASP